MDTPSSSSELYQVRTKIKMPLATSSSTGVATLHPKLFQPTSPTSIRSSFSAQSSINHGNISELRFSPRAARYETPAQGVKKNSDSGMVPFLHTEAPILSSSSDVAPISWKDYIPEINHEVSRVNSGEQSMKINGENKSKDNLFTFGTISEVEISESSHGMPHTDSAQSFGSVFNSQEYIPQITKEGSNQGKSQVVDVQNQSNDSIFSFGTVSEGQSMEGLSFSNYITHKDQFDDFHARPQKKYTQSLERNIGSPSFLNYINSRNQFGESHETPVASSKQSLGTQSLVSSLSPGKYLPKTSQESDVDKLAKQAEKLSVQNQSSDCVVFGTDTGVEKTEHLSFRDYIIQKNKTEKAYEKPPTNSIEILDTPSFSLGFKFEDYLPEITQNVNTIHPDEHSEIPNVKEKSKVNTSLSGNSGEGAKVESSFSSPVGGFAFTSKNGESKALKNEIKGPRRRYIKIQKKGGHNMKEKKFGDSIEESKFNFEESSTFKPERNTNLSSDNTLLFDTSNEDANKFNFEEISSFKPERNTNLSSDNTLLFDTSNEDANINGTSFSFSDANLNPILLKRNSETTPLYSSFIGARTDGPSLLSEFKKSEKTPVSVSVSHFGEKNMSKFGRSSFKIRNASMQFGSPELLRTFSFPSKPRSGSESEKYHEFPNISIYGTSRSSGIDNDGEKWRARLSSI
jgi:hypothetical protein